MRPRRHAPTVSGSLVTIRLRPTIRCPGMVRGGVSVVLSEPLVKVGTGDPGRSRGRSLTTRPRYFADCVGGLRGSLG